MARNVPNAVQQYRGTTAQHAAYTGPAGELTVDTDKKAVVVQDGVTAGGITMAREDRTITVGSGLKVGNNASSSTLANDFTINFDGAAAAADLVSNKAGNTLTVANGAGEDGKLYIASVGVSDLIDPNDELLHVDATSGKIATGVELAYNTTTGKLDITNHAGTVVATVTIPSSVSMLESAALVVDPAGQEPGTYLKLTLRLADNTTTDLLVNVSDLIDVYTAGDGLQLSNNEFSVKLLTNGGLETDANGQLSVKKSDLVSSTQGNALTVDANGLFVPTTVAPTIVSTDANNLITAGNDGGAFADCAALRSTATGNQIVCNSNALFVASDYGTMD